MRDPTLFELRLGPFYADYCRNYGIDHRRGWTIEWDGSVVSELRHNLLCALIEAARTLVLVHEHPLY